MAVQVINGPNGTNGINALETVAPPGYARAYASTTVQVVRQGVLRPAAYAQWTPLYPGTESGYLAPLYGDPYGETPLTFPQRADSRGVIQIWAPEPVRVELQVFVYGYPTVKQVIDLQFTEDPGDDALDALAAHAADTNDPHAAAGYITMAEADAQFLTPSEADVLFLTQEEGDARYAMAGLSGITQDAADVRYVNVVGDTMSGNLVVGTPTLSTWQGKGVQVGQQGSLMEGASGNQLYLGQNIVYDGSFKAVADAQTSYYMQIAGDHAWYSTPTAVAGAAVTPQRKMYLRQTGVLQVDTDAGGTNLLLSQSGGTGWQPRVIFERNMFTQWKVGFGPADEWEVRSEDTRRFFLTRTGTVTILPDTETPGIYLTTYNLQTTPAVRIARQITGGTTWLSFAGGLSYDYYIGRKPNDDGLYFSRWNGVSLTDRMALTVDGTLNITPDGGYPSLVWGLGAGSLTVQGVYPRISGTPGWPFIVGGMTALQPTPDNAVSLGWGDARWTQVCATNGVIQTSSVAYKDREGDLDPEAALAAVLRTPARRFRYKGTERVQSGYYLEEADPLFTIGPDEASPSNDAGVLIAAVQALAARMGITPEVTL